MFLKMAEQYHQDNNCGLKMLFGFNRLIGTCYSWWNFGSNLKLKYKIINIIMAVVTIITSSYYSYDHILTMIEPIKHKVTGRSNMTMVVAILISASYFLYSIKCIYLFLFSIIRMKNIFEFLNDQDIRISYRSERKIGLILIISQIGILLITEAIFPLTTLILHGLDKFEVLENLIVFLSFIIVENFQATMITLLAYQCCVIEVKLNELTQNFTSLNKFSTISQQILRIQYSVKGFDQMTTQFTFFSLMVNSINCVSNVALLYHDGLRTDDFVIGDIVECIVEIFLVCYLSNKMSFAITRINEQVRNA